ncbi:protein SYM1-like [Penaeus japonicus]|uniref:protein SYM1-like n=1 Tax=Penaeus japonicus TaxID=27405 RepID=UPI001C713277|nr:protein SYM1-like [Penaeus japonicus]
MQKMPAIMNKLRVIVEKYPVTRGILTYSVLFPASNTTQQLMDPKREKYNGWETLRFGIFGALILAPSLYCWVRLANVIVKGSTLKHAVIKAYIEQFTWAPFAYTEFYLCINLMERKTLDECLHECRTKIPPTWKIGFCVWPVIQTVNFWIIPLKHRVSFVGFFSYVWNTFLSYMHHCKMGDSDGSKVGKMP